jgi:hypothetical protein
VVAKRDSLAMTRSNGSSPSLFPVDEDEYFESLKAVGIETDGFVFQRLDSSEGGPISFWFFSWYVSFLFLSCSGSVFEINNHEQARQAIQSNTIQISLERSRITRTNSQFKYSSATRMIPILANRGIGPEALSLQ